MKITLTIQNYRCFARPTSVTISKDFTAFVGLNNSGKSAFMRFLLELRPMFERMRSSHNLNAAVQNQESTNVIEVLDPEEIFNNRSNAEIKFTISFDYDAQDATERNSLAEATFTLRRNLHWQAFLKNLDGHVIHGATISMNNGTKVFTDRRSGASVHSTELTRLAEKLQNTLYIGPFRNAINAGSNANYIDIQVGDAFIANFVNLKHGNGKRNNNAIIDLTEDIRKIFGFDTLTIDATPDGKSLNIAVNGRSYKQHELGSGLAQFIIVLANASTKQPSFVLIDEPELGLHPSLQLDFLTTLASHASEGVWFSTHSIGLARSVTDQIYSVRRASDGDSVVTLMDEIPRLGEFLGEMSFSAHKDLGFEKILLVEGATEVKAIQQILRKMSKDHKIVLLPLFGGINGNIADQLSEVTRISTEVYALIDSEKTSVTDVLSTPRQSFVTLCSQMNIDCHVLDRRATENYFSDIAIKRTFGENFRALSNYEAFKDVQPRWSKTQNWRVAQAMSIEEIMQTDLGEFLKKL